MTVRKNRDKFIFTFTVSQWFTRPEAMQKLADIIHAEGAPVSWLLSLETALAERDILEDYHRRFGDDLVMIRHQETIEDWRKQFPWATLTVVGGPRQPEETLRRWQAEGIRGTWGYCDQQIGPDGVTHWGCPWGLFYINPKISLIPPQEDGTMIGTPWTLRDLHKCYHLRQAINFGMDVGEQARSKNLCWGENVTFYQDLIDEWVANLPWNERIYCCLHEEAHGPFIPPGKSCSEEDERVGPKESEAMYGMIRHWVRYAREQGARMMTLPQAVADYQSVAKGRVLPSTILTRDKFHGSIVHYTQPMPLGVPQWNFSSAGSFPDTLFYYDAECQLVFTHPNFLPVQVVNYRAQHPLVGNRPYPREDVLPNLVDWSSKREGDVKTFTYRIQSYYTMPYGIAEWGDFGEWEVDSTNATSVTILDDRVAFVRCELAPHGKTSEEINEEADKGFLFWFKLRRKTGSDNQGS